MSCPNSRKIERSRSGPPPSMSSLSNVDRAVASELDAMRRLPARQPEVPFPHACRSLVLSLPGNSCCADCGALRPEWASVSYGVLLCVQCSGRHRSYGVASSRVKSIDMDAWTHDQVLSMLEGGNEQLTKFFDRHQMMDETMTCRRYKTKAALYYRTHLRKHVTDLGQSVYKGREASRSKSPTASGRSGRKPSSATASPDSSPTLTTQNSQSTAIQQGIVAN